MSLSLEAIKDYYHYFFSDDMVFDYPWVVRFFLREWVAKRKRANKILKEYEEIWDRTANLSPLHKYFQSFISKLSERISERGLNIKVYYANLYSPPFVEDAIGMSIREGAQKITIFYMVGQHCWSVTGSLYKRIWKSLERIKVFPEISVLFNTWNDEKFIQIWEKKLRNALKTFNPDVVLFSFHGVPVGHIKKSDLKNCTYDECCKRINAENTYCYRAECFYMADLLASRCGCKNYEVVFQSRFGKEKWTEPYIIDSVKKWLNSGARNFIIVPLSFYFDCLETLYELGIEVASKVKEKCGKCIVIPAPNDSDDFINFIIEKIR